VLRLWTTGPANYPIFFYPVFLLHPYPWRSEINWHSLFGLGFFRILCSHPWPKNLQSLATSDILAGPHSSRYGTFHAKQGTQYRDHRNSIGCRLSEILSDPASPTSVRHQLGRELPVPSAIFCSSPMSRAVTAFRTTLILPRGYGGCAECDRVSATSHIPPPGHDSIFCSFTALPSNHPRVRVSAGKRSQQRKTHHPLGIVPQLQALGTVR
jgi:hypothetical protein